MLAGGYLGYRLAYTGKDRNHKTADTVFLSLVFGLVAKIVYGWLDGFRYPSWVTVALALMSALAVSAVWRKWGQRSVFKIFRKTRISSHDSLQTAWDSILADDGMKASQIVVRRKDGITVMCNDLHAFEKTRTGPFYLGQDGSVALYVTHQKETNGDWEDVSDDINSPDGGSLITIIPAGQITSTQLRNK